MYTRLTLTGLIVSVGGCGAQDLAPVGQSGQDLTSENGLSINGLSINGLSINGLATAGLATGNLNTDRFSTWFNQNLTLAPMVMSYIVRCALPADASLTWTNPATGTSYTWPGDLGLTPIWVSGRPPTTIEQQLISACLAAHTNKYGVHIPLSVNGLTEDGEPVGVTPSELATYSVSEGCFFGNLFTGEGVFAGSSDILFHPANSSPRACALETPPLEGGAQVCSPIVNVGLCYQYCTLDITGTYYTQCTYQGVTYRPLKTRILPQDVYTCGDGICQFTESCGTGTIPSSCMADCGVCPAN